MISSAIAWVATNPAPINAALTTLVRSNPIPRDIAPKPPSFDLLPCFPLRCLVVSLHR